MLTLIILKKEQITSRFHQSFKSIDKTPVLFSFKQDCLSENYSLNEENLVLYQNLSNKKCLSNKPTDWEKENLCFAAYHFKQKRFWGRRDRLGNKPFYYINSPDFFIFSNSIASLKQHLNKPKLNLNSAGRILMGIPPEKTASFYEEIHHLPAGHELIFQNDQISIRPYFNLEKTFEEERNSKGQSSMEELQAAFEQAILSRRKGLTGSELSGGLDSSGIASFLFHHAPQETLHLFRHTQSSSQAQKFYPYGDEKFYSNQVIEHLNEQFPQQQSKLHIHDAEAQSNGIVKELRKSIQGIGSPFNSTLVLFFDEIYQKGQEAGIQTLFSGFGGDEVISSKAFFYISELKDKKQWLKLSHIIGRLPAFKSFIKHYLLPTNKNTSPKWAFEKFNNHLLHPDFLHNLSGEDIFSDYFSHLFPPHFNEDILSRLNNNALISRMEENSIIAQTYGTEYAYPFFDPELILTYMRLPIEEKLDYQLPRKAYRKLIRPYLPKNIYNRTHKTSATVPTVFYRFLKDYDLIMNTLEGAKQSEAANIIDIDRSIERLKLIRVKNETRDLNMRLDLPILIAALQIIIALEEDGVGL